jgi:hypothetical protein
MLDIEIRAGEKNFKFPWQIKEIRKYLI